MSFECAECEMDLRHGTHAPECSRYRPEREVSSYLVENDLIHETDAAEVERLVVRVIADERDRLRKEVEAMRATHQRLAAAERAQTVGYDPLSEREEAIVRVLDRVLALLDKPGEP